MVDYSLGNRLVIIFCVLLIINIILYYNDSSSSSDPELVTLQSTFFQTRSALNTSEVKSISALRSLQDSFDYICPASFQVYTYRLAKEERLETVRNLHKWFLSSNYAVQEPSTACLFVVVTSSNTPTFDFASYKYWNSTGQNHLVVFVNAAAPIQTNNTWDAIFVSSQFKDGDLSREEVDLFAKCETDSSDCLFDLACSDNPKLEERFELCSDQFYRAKVGLSSTFTLVLPSANSNQQRIFEALMYNSIPVVVGDQPLPFQDFIDWNRASVRLPRGQLHQLMTILKQISQQKIFEMRRAGRFYMDYYIGDAKVLARSILSGVRFRLGLPAPPEKTAKVSLLLTSLEKEGLNVTKTVIDSFSARSNEETYFLWNRNPTYLDASFSVSFSVNAWLTNADLSQSFINLEKHPKFSDTLSGNHPPELFTIVMLSYKRDDQVQYTLKQMDGLPFLHSIIVVWNDVGRQPPASWPRIHVPIHVLNASHNSLNNRFLPLELIRTEAVFNMDDDFNVKHEDIIFSFRVWRENRDVIVGPNFRLGYVKDGKGFYEAAPQCQYNMVLTSGAFIHKAYLQAYTNQMPEVIRERIDKLHNCEDIAVNFLVSRLTRKPPIKTTPIINTKGKFSSQGLSTRHSHYTERSECILFFTQVYGYNPLVVSEYRADSVLYNMSEKKCFANT